MWVVLDAEGNIYFSSYGRTDCVHWRANRPFPEDYGIYWEE